MRSVISCITVIVCVALFTNLCLCLQHSLKCDYEYYREADGWLKLQTSPASWPDARTRCHYEGGTLASPTSGLLDSMTAVMNQYDEVTQIYVGIHGHSTVQYSTIEGLPVSQIPHVWAADEPNGYYNQESCLVMNKDSTLAVKPCEGQTYPYMCYKRNDGTRVNECGTTDQSYTKDSRTGNCYKFHRFSKDWFIARMICDAEGGYLAIINSDTEAEVIKDLYAKVPEYEIKDRYWPNVAFIGFQMWNDTSEFMTIHGQSLTSAGYDKFSLFEPNNWPPGEYCGAVYRSGYLLSHWCPRKHPFICERRPDSSHCYGPTSVSETGLAATT